MASVNCLDFQKLIIQIVFLSDLSQIPASFYLGLGRGPLPAASATLASITEVTGLGYSRKRLDRGTIDWPTLQVTGGNWKVSSDTRRFAPSGGDWTAADYGFLTDVASGTAGRLFCAASLNSPFLLLNGDSWDGTAEWSGSA